MLFENELRETDMLNQAKANLLALIESTEDLIWSVDVNYGLLTFNKALQQDIEQSFDVRAAAGMRPEDLLPPERAAFWPPLYHRALSEGPFRVEYPLIDGRTMEMSFNRIVIDGKTTGVSVFGKDITKRKATEKALLEAEKKYRDMFDGALEGIFQASIEFRVLTANGALAKMLGYDLPDDLISAATNLVQDVWVDGDELPTVLQQLEEHGTIRGFECQLKRKDGTVIWASLNARRVCDTDGRALYHQGYIEDITERKLSEMKLRDSEKRYRAVFQTSLDAICISHFSDGRYIEVNKAFLDLVGFELREVIGRTSLELNFWTDPRDRQEMEDVLHQNSSVRDSKTRFRKKNGEIFWVLISASVIEIEGNSYILSVVQDISDAKAAENEIRNLAFYDPLTHLPNRRLLLDRLQQNPTTRARNRHKRALLFVELDNFKTLNDAFGRQMGDLLLQEVALRLIVCVRGTDTVARLGRDEFVVMIENLSRTSENAAAQVKAVGEKIRAAVGQPFLLAGHEFHMTASIGIAVFGAYPEGTNEVLQQAEIAMFQAKAAGRNTICFFSPALQATVNSRAAMEEDLREAIRTNQFLLYYQPQVEGTNLIGAEALIRWKHPAHGLLAPGEFIPLAEDTGLIRPLGDWVLNTACTQIAAWAALKELAQIPVAVNISAQQFGQPDFVEQVLTVLDRTGANPQNLKLELTESILVENIEDVIAKMKDLKSHGLRFSLDDFGTGYSSMSYLKRLPLDQLKVDRTFVQDILVDVTNGAIAQSIISLGRAMGLSVVAEGVETKEQRDFLICLGCHTFQGCLFSRPLPLEEFQRFWLGSAESAVPVPE